MRQVRVAWVGPLSIEQALQLDDQDNDYGLYQIYGQHIIFGPGSLLYIGMAREQTFKSRLRQHDVDWLHQEKGVLVRVGRIDPGDYAYEPDNWPDWYRLLGDTEALEIYWHSPPYNSSNISEYKGQDLRILNEGERGSLSQECASEKLQPRPLEEGRIGSVPPGTG